MMRITLTYLRIITMLLLCSTTTLFAQWQQIGDDILGVTEFDSNGRSVALSQDGLTVAIGANTNDINGNLAGMARVFNFNGTEWQQVGTDFLGEDANDNFGYSIALSNDGTIVAIGAPSADIGSTIYGETKIYQYDGSNWNLMGNSIIGLNSSGSSWSIDLNGTGMRVAIGATTDSSVTNRGGSASIYEFDGTDWILLGNKIDGIIEQLRMGHSIGINTAGDRIVVGTKDANPAIVAGGYVEVYDFDGTTWNKLGNTLNSEADTDAFGEGVDISGDGTRIIIGARNHDTGGSDAGRVYIYEYNGTTWELSGNPLDGQSGTQYGESIAISEQGNRIIVGAVQDSSNGSLSGAATIYQYNGATWSSLSTPITGMQASDYAGDTVTINNDGSIVAYGGAISSTGNGAGVVRVFDDSLLTVDIALVQNAIIAYPNPTSNIVQFNSMTNDTKGEMKIFSSAGQKISSMTFESLNMMKIKLPEATGLYFIHVITNSFTQVLKIIKH